ncbi:MAG: CPBP family intramembrane metalloprotease, partial [Lachnospiraceae bacterium]|nr:CPBP family intramembrane metalloprotease [Lachnospiraceae bacterium]
MIDKRTSIGVTILTIIMTFMEMTALPAALFCNIQIRDIEPIY